MSKMNKILYFLFLTISFHALSAGEEMVVKLGTGVELLPVYISSEKNEGSGFSADYLDQLEKILKFDFSHNGMTSLALPSKARTQLDRTTPFDFQGDLSAWVKENIYYIIKIKAKDRKLAAKILITNSNGIKAVEGLPLTGVLSQDRRTIHQLADSIFKALFDKEGVASTKFLYAQKSKSADKKWVSSIFEADYDGANARQITANDDFAINPSYIYPKPGFRSNMCLFVSYKTGQPKIYFGSLSGDAPQRFSLLKGNQLLPAMSKQRDKIAFISDVTGNPDLFLQEFDAEKGPIGKPRQIYSTHRATQGSPSFSPDGRQIAFVSNKDGSPRIYVMDIPEPGVALKDIKANLVTKVNRENTAPCWSPDGSKIAFCAQTKGVRQIWVYDLLAKTERQVTKGPKNKENPTFAPNSLHLIFNTSDSGDSELYLMNLNQPDAVKISSGSGEKYFPSWEPIGEL